MPAEHEPPLNQRELRIVRSLIQDRLFRDRQRGYWRNLFGDARVVLLFVGVACSTGLQVAALILHHH